ncbi:ribbon-helix-helix protein, CopG family [Nonlabens agnitus]|uniref:CopG family transcriptional regulator n=1 Tax=Nonlabens agnitus TaxID=870484 RepID=A0A2S9WUE9_9FLAO|nr:ribbon-helix-helix protein, CopG family [Nonlabens agnitus]PRP67084.1 CopG family transcriptional regulator [Nonlabens agnitus]
MATFTSSLPDDLLQQLAKKAKELKLPKNQLIEKALSIYLEQLDRAAYIKSYKRAGKDPDMIAMAEEGMADYFQQLQDLEDETE